MAREIKVTVDVKQKELTIVMPLLEPKASKSGKNLTIASTFGNFPSNATFDGKTIVLGVNAYIRND